MDVSRQSNEGHSSSFCESFNVKKILFPNPYGNPSTFGALSIGVAKIISHFIVMNVVHYPIAGFFTHMGLLPIPLAMKHSFGIRL